MKLELIVAAVGIVGLVIMTKLARRSGVHRAELLHKLPGDEIIGEAGYIADHATLIDESAETVWPWLVQMGKHRAGWYGPYWLERLMVADKTQRGARHIMPELQKLKVGDTMPDWGGGQLKVASIDPPYSLVYVAVNDPKQTDNFAFSMAYVLDAVDSDHCRLHTRLRMRRSKHKLTRILMVFLPVGGFLDYLTNIALHAGLKERSSTDK